MKTLLMYFICAAPYVEELSQWKQHLLLTGVLFRVFYTWTPLTACDSNTEFLQIKMIFNLALLKTVDSFFFPFTDSKTDLKLFFFFFFFSFLQPHLQHMEVPRLGVKFELQLSAYATAMVMPDQSGVCDLHCSLWPSRIFNPLSEARVWTHILTDTMSGS